MKDVGKGTTWREHKQYIEEVLKTLSSIHTDFSYYVESSVRGSVPREKNNLGSGRPELKFLFPFLYVTFGQLNPSYYLIPHI